MNTDMILLDHGSGGAVSHDLISRLVLPAFDNRFLAAQDDGAVLELPRGRLAFSTDTFVVDPIFFPGGNIGDLAVNGTVNDLAMCGATPLYLSAGLILEEGLPQADLAMILQSMGQAANRAGVIIVTGDTKVVPRGKADKIFINTSGIGVIPEGVCISGKQAAPGDRILISGTLADHGIAILTTREGLRCETVLESDSAPLNTLVRAILDTGAQVHVLRDPTRGGVATTLNEVARQSGVGMILNESALPVKPEIRGVCELLGLDPLYVANEGKMIVVVPAPDAPAVLAAMQAHESGRDAAIIGQVVSGDPGRVVLRTAIGGTRRVDMMTGAQLPRIC